MNNSLNTNGFVYKTGDIFESTCQTIVVAVNTVGVMGKGQALRCNELFPNVLDVHRKLCFNRQLKIGRLQVVPVGENKQLLLFPTKAHWRNPSKYQYIEEGLDDLVNRYQELNIQSLALLPLGCGLGGLDSDNVLARIESKLTDLPINIELYNF